MASTVGNSHGCFTQVVRTTGTCNIQSVTCVPEEILNENKNSRSALCFLSVFIVCLTRSGLRERLPSREGYSSASDVRGIRDGSLGVAVAPRPTLGCRLCRSVGLSLQRSLRADAGRSHSTASRPQLQKWTDLSFIELFGEQAFTEAWSGYIFTASR